MSRTKEEIMKEIDAIVEKSIQPSVEMHGGVVKLQDFDMKTGDVKLEMINNYEKVKLVANYELIN